MDCKYSQSCQWGCSINCTEFESVNKDQMRDALRGFEVTERLNKKKS